MPDAERDLRAYRAKRAAGRTPEPFSSSEARPGLYVVQQHAARRLHFDLRLEWQGVLLSWAVPRGPSLDPAQKRLAVRVEDHPLDYADFEGTIPEGNYGAGSVIVWDLGRWVPVEDPAEGLERGKLLFDLHGYKLGGRWTLVRTTRRGERERSKEWLLIKKADGYADSNEEVSAESVLSGQTLEQIGRESTRSLRALARLEELDVPRRRMSVSRLRPMLAERCPEAFSREGWIFEVKYDGFRAIASRDHDRIQLRYRSGRDATAVFPEIERSLRALPYPQLVIDGELVVHDAAGRPSFQRLQKRAQLRRPTDVLRAAVDQPVTFWVFDLLGFGGYDLRSLPLLERKQILESLLPSHGVLRYVPHFATRGEAVYAEAVKLGFEGVVAKRADAPYRSGRSPAWQKIRTRETGDFVVVGFSAPRGARSGFGALHLATVDDGALRYVGRVGSGFPEAQLRSLRTRLETLRRSTPPISGLLPSSAAPRWVEPRLVAEVEYAEMTEDGLLRQPVFVRLREDKAPADCQNDRPSPHHSDEPEPSDDAPPSVPVEEPRRVPFTNLDKVFWPEDGTTKGDLLDYQRRIAPWLLPYLRDRPLVLTRYPDGIRGKSFFQKDAPDWVPDWVRTETLWSEHGGREIHYFVCDDLESLLYVVNLGTIPLHVWSSRVADLAHPDWSILDLDPKDAPFAHVIEVARQVRRLCDELELPSFVKTSGSTGLHVLVPLGGRLTYEQSRSLAELIARVVVKQLPEIATIARPLGARRGRVYLDTGQNGHGRLLVAPFSVRPLPGAPVSMPLRWREVNGRLDPRRFTIRNAANRLRRLGEDPLRPVLAARPDLLGALERLSERLGSEGG